MNGWEIGTLVFSRAAKCPATTSIVIKGDNIEGHKVVSATVSQWAVRSGFIPFPLKRPKIPTKWDSH